MKVEGNIFAIGKIHSNKKEVFETILERGDFKIERIITLDPYTEPGKWYDQDLDEWVILLRGNAKIEFKEEGIIDLNAGDYIFIQAHKTHRINQSGTDEKNIWLTVHGKLK